MYRQIQFIILQSVQQSESFLFYPICNIILIENRMFDRCQNQQKYDHLFNEKTAAQFGEPQEESFVYEVEAEKEYVNRLRTQREKIETLYSKYDVLLRDLKTKEVQIKQKDKTISSLENKCKTLVVTAQESNTVKQQNHNIKTENVTLQKAISELEESYNMLNGQFRNKTVVTSQKYEEMEGLNDQLMGKLRTLSKRYQEREEQFAERYQDAVNKFQEFKFQARKEKETLMTENGMLKNSLMQREEEVKLMKAENQCLKERIIQIQSYLNELTLESEEKLEVAQKEKKCQVRALKNEMDLVRENNIMLQKKLLKAKEECQMRELSLGELGILLEQHEKQSNQAISALRQQHNQEKSMLKQQLIHCQNHIAKLQRKIADSVRKEQCLHGKIKKYQVCLDAKRNLREVQKEELQRINMLLNLP